jgi:solute carrier family 45, member 1/2/4
LTFSPTIAQQNSEEPELKPGVILGLHNMYLCLPQFVAIFLSSLIFAIFKEDSFGWAIRFGGIFSIIAGFIALKVEQYGHNRQR